MTEEQLWCDAREGDDAAFAVVFDLHRNRVYRHACRLVETQHDAEDVAAVAFFELWRRRVDVRLVDGSVLPWLLVTTTNVARNRQRAARRYQALLERLPRRPSVLSEPTPLPDGIAAGLRSLAGPDLHLLYLVALEGYSVKDAGDVLGLRETAARSRLHRARARVRNISRATVVEDA